MNNIIIKKDSTVLFLGDSITDVKFNGLKEKTNFDKNYFQIQRHKTINTSGGDDYYD